MYAGYFVPNMLDPFGLICEPEHQAMMTALTIRDIKLQYLNESEQRLARIQQEVNADAAANSGQVNVGLLALLATYLQAAAENRADYQQAATAAGEAAAAYARCMRGDPNPPPPPKHALCNESWAGEAPPGAGLLLPATAESLACRPQFTACFDRCKQVCCDYKISICQNACWVEYQRCIALDPATEWNNARAVCCGS